MANITRRETHHVPDPSAISVTPHDAAVGKFYHLPARAQVAEGASLGFDDRRFASHAYCFRYLAYSHADVQVQDLFRLQIDVPANVRLKPSRFGGYGVKPWVQMVDLITAEQIGSSLPRDGGALIRHRNPYSDDYRIVRVSHSASNSSERSLGVDD